MKQIFLTTTLTVAVLAPLGTQAQDLQAPTDSRNRFSIGPRFGLNLQADFKTRGNFSPANPDAPVGGIDHTYDDGYVLVDVSGNAGGLTWNWGYDNSSQVVGDTMQFHAAESAARASAQDDPQYGFELVYQRVLGDLPGISSHWGLEVGLGFSQIDLRSDRRGNVSVLTDSYNLNGVIPPSAGYQGTFDGPGALLGDTPTRTFDTGSLSSDQSLCGQMFTIRLGPFIEWNFTKKMSLAASVGLTLAPTTIDFDFSETVALTGGGTYSSRGKASNTELLYGPYISTTLSYDFTKRWSAYIGAQFQSLTDMKQSVGNHTARLDPGAMVYITAGITWKF